jgi:hypothetical protein
MRTSGVANNSNRRGIINHKNPWTLYIITMMVAIISDKMNGIKVCINQMKPERSPPRQTKAKEWFWQTERSHSGRKAPT